MMLEGCEYCDRDDVTLYAWHADAWCASCIRDDGRPHGDLASAPIGRPENPTYEQPFVLQTPDGRVVAGVVVG